MNAILSPAIETIDSYQDFLTADFVTETKARHEEIQKNKQGSLESAEDIKASCDKMADAIGGAGQRFQEGSRLFDRLAVLSRTNADQWFEATKMIREASEKIMQSKARREKWVRENGETR